MKFGRRYGNLRCRQKSEYFGGGVILEFLPTQQILHVRHVEPIANCEVCGSDEETIRHVLCECTVARDFWDHAKTLAGVKLLDLHPVTWAYDLVCGRVVSGENQAMIIVGIYSLWTQRNKRRHGEQSLPIRESVRWAMDLAYDLRMGQQHWRGSD